MFLNCLNGKCQMARVDGFVLSWEYSGPYQKDNASLDELLNEVFAPEQDPAGCKWLELPAMTNASQPWALDLKKIDPGDSMVIYLRTAVVSERETAAVLAIGSDDGVKIRLNDNTVHSNNAMRAIEARQDTVNVKLRKGRNEFLVKVTQGSGGWAFCMEILDDAGKPLEDVKVIPW